MAIFSGIQGDADAAAGTAANSQSKLQKDLNRFLKLLVTQLKHQDPLDPMDANEFTSQLVQFASVEQQIKQNSHLENMLRLQETGQVANMVTYIGTKIEASGDTFMLKDGQAKMSYTLPADTAFKSVRVSIEDEKGNLVYSKDGVLKSGQHIVNWDGKTKSGLQLKDGKYVIKVHAENNQGKKTEVGYSVFGTVTGMAAEDGVLQMYMDDVKVPFASVLSVHKGDDAPMPAAAQPAAPAETEETDDEDGDDDDDGDDDGMDDDQEDASSGEQDTTATVTRPAPEQQTVTTVMQVPGDGSTTTTTTPTVTRTIQIP